MHDISIGEITMDDLENETYQKEYRVKSSEVRWVRGESPNQRTEGYY